MASWVLIPCLVTLRAEIDRLAPGRGKASDGSIGDTAHQHTSSDHNPDETGTVPIRDADKLNEVHAIDLDKDLNESDLTMEKVVQFLLGRCRSGAEQRLRYIIYNRRIWSASSDWVQKAYAGKNPHIEHVHFSASYTTKHEASTASWHLEEIPVSLTTADKTWLTGTIKAVVAAEVKAVLAGERDDIANQIVFGTPLPGTNAPGNSYRRSIADVLADFWALSFFSKTKGGDPVPAEGVFGKLLANTDKTEETA